MRHLLMATLLASFFNPAASAQIPTEPAPKRNPHPLAPSIPELTEEEEKKLDEVVDRFILFDTGKLRGAEGQQAYRDFANLGPEAIPALLRGLNRSAAINHSCPVTVIAAKLNKLLLTSNDVKLLEFARDEIGSSVYNSPHKAVLQDLRFQVTTRKNALQRAGVGVSTAPLPRTLTTDQLLQEASKERGDRLRSLIGELGQRDGDEVLSTLGTHAAGMDKETQQFARNALFASLNRLKADDLRAKLKDEKSEVRFAAVRVVRHRNHPFGAELIELIDDSDATVREWAHTTLIKMNRGVDLGPSKIATKDQIENAKQSWRSWWEKQGKKK